jgi:hypothetical protein
MYAINSFVSEITPYKELCKRIIDNLLVHAITSHSKKLLMPLFIKTGIKLQTLHVC